jgi:cytochrome d ubiquinol oxidase subunit I
LSRWQSAITVMSDMIFPAITVGLSILLSVAYSLLA